LRTQAIFFYALLAAVIGLSLMGCATGPSASAAPSQADLLTQAGFIKHTVNSPEKAAAIQTLPAKKVVSNQYNGKVFYLVCTDPSGGQCFLGDKAAYERYQQLAIQNNIAEDQHKVSEQRSDPEFWELWVASQGGL
jgi:hypothetical protein